MSLQRERRIKGYTLIPMVVIGIVAGALVGMAFALGGLGIDGAGGPRNPASLIFFVAPPAVCWALGWIAYKLALRFAPVRPDETDGL
jgi:hypothetical protein